jgi:hypothetical protein
LHYSRGGQQVSLRRADVFFIRQTIPVLLGLLAVLSAAAQYPGRVEQKAKDVPVLRAVGVLEWTGPAGKPQNSRLIPVTVFDGENLQDGGVYLARPQPLAVSGGVEYILEKNGKHIGLFDIRGAGQMQGSWFGLGAWKPMPNPKPKIPPAELAMSQFDEEESDRPVLHRKVHPGEAPADGSSSKTGSSRPAPAPDPDRPTLHKSSPSEGSAGSPAEDSDRPTLTKAKSEKSAKDAGYVESLPDVTDPDRPRLLRGKYTEGGAVLVPTLMGLPPDMQQVVAVSDAQNHPEHPWSFKWSNPADEAKMKAEMEDAARAALGLNAPPPAPPPAPKRRTAKAISAPPPPPPPPAPLVDEKFRVFELAYGSGATMVLTAHTDGSAGQQKFVTLIAQPDLYGSLLVLFKSVTDNAHLDLTPRMHLIDAVDAMADNRGELLFELRGSNQRQFALYRVLRGSVEKLFVTGGGEFGMGNTE